MKYRELRFLSSEACELRAAGEDDAPVIEGYAARFNVLSEDLGFGREMIRPGAFKRTLDNGTDVVALWAHNTAEPLARRSTGGLDLEEDAKGLRVRIRPDDTSVTRDLLAWIRSGTVKDMSFGFRTIEDEWHTDDGETIRTLVEAQLLDVSPVTSPAYPQTSVAVRSMLAFEGAEDEQIRELAESSEIFSNPQLTTAEFRSILDPIVRELRDHRDGPAPASHPERDATAAMEARRRALDLLEVEA